MGYAVVGMFSRKASPYRHIDAQMKCGIFLWFPPSTRRTQVYDTSTSHYVTHTYDFTVISNYRSLITYLKLTFVPHGNSVHTFGAMVTTRWRTMGCHFAKLATSHITSAIWLSALGTSSPRRGITWCMNVFRPFEHKLRIYLLGDVCRSFGRCVTLWQS